MDANALRLEYGSRSSEISLGKIESAEIKSGWIWSRVQLRYDGGESVVSGLSSDDAQAFIKALEIARTRWWQRELTPQIGILRSVCDGLALLADPPTYLTHSAFNKLRNEAESAAGQFTDCWPNALSDTPEFRMLRAILDFLEDPDRFRTQANAAFVANELKRSQELFDRIESRPLTEEQRKTVVVDDDRNLVIAAAGSGKTSVIVAKAGWLLHRGYRRPSELLLMAFARDARKEMEERVRKRLDGDSAQGITVSTFHSLGLAIIGKVEGPAPGVDQGGRR